MVGLLFQTFSTLRVSAIVRLLRCGPGSGSLPTPRNESRAQAVRRVLVDLETGVPYQLGRKPGRGSDRDARRTFSFAHPPSVRELRDSPEPREYQPMTGPIGVTTHRASRADRFHVQ